MFKGGRRGGCEVVNQTSEKKVVYSGVGDVECGCGVVLPSLRHRTVVPRQVLPRVGNCCVGRQDILNSSFEGSGRLHSISLLSSCLQALNRQSKAYHTYRGTSFHITNRERK